MTAVDLSRWGLRDGRQYNWERCRFCGYAGKDCPPTTCRACGTRQCQTPGDSKCLVCFIGICDGYAVTLYDKFDRPTPGTPTCGYAKCDGQPAARVLRVNVACAYHLSRAKVAGVGRQITAVDYIARQLQIRDRKIRDRQQEWLPLAWITA